MNTKNITRHKKMTDIELRSEIEKIFNEYNKNNPRFKSIMEMPMTPKFRIDFDQAMKDRMKWELEQ